MICCLWTVLEQLSGLVDPWRRLRLVHVENHTRQGNQTCLIIGNQNRAGMQLRNRHITNKIKHFVVHALRESVSKATVQVLLFRDRPPITIPGKDFVRFLDSDRESIPRRKGRLKVL
jgi:hypothetical protein